MRYATITRHFLRDAPDEYWVMIFNLYGEVLYDGCFGASNDAKEFLKQKGYELIGSEDRPESYVALLVRHEPH